MLALGILGGLPARAAEEADDAEREADLLFGSLTQDRRVGRLIRNEERRLVALELRGGDVSDAHLAWLPRLRLLASLTLEATATTDKGFAHVAACPSLQDLTLRSVRVTDGVLARLAGLAKLERLVVATRTPQSVTDLGFAALRPLGNLREVAIAGASPIGPGVGVTDASIAVLAGLPRLFQADLSATQVTSQGAARLAGHPALRRLRVPAYPAAEHQALVLALSGVTVLGPGEPLPSVPAPPRASSSAPQDVAPPQDVEGFVQRAEARLQSGDLDGAIADADAAIRLQPKAWAGRLIRGVARQRKGDAAGALADATEAERLGARHPLVFRVLAAAAASLGDHDRALQAWATLERMRPLEAPELTLRATSRSAKGDRAGARADLDQAVALDPTNAGARVLRAGVHAEAKEWDYALADLQMAVSLSPDEPTGLLELAWLRATCPKDDIRNGDEAVDLATRLVERGRATHTLWALDALAAAYAEVGRFPDAVAAAEKALELESVPEIRHRLDLYRAGKPYRQRP